MASLRDRPRSDNPAMTRERARYGWTRGRGWWFECARCGIPRAWTTITTEDPDDPVELRAFVARYHKHATEDQFSGGQP